MLIPSGSGNTLQTKYIDWIDAIIVIGCLTVWHGNRKNINCVYRVLPTLNLRQWALKVPAGPMWILLPISCGLVILFSLVDFVCVHFALTNHIYCFCAVNRDAIPGKCGVSSRRRLVAVPRERRVTRWHIATTSIWTCTGRHVGSLRPSVFFRITRNF